MSIVKINKITYSLKWPLDDCCWSSFHKCYITLDITMFDSSFSAEREYECQILLCQLLFAFRHKNNSLSLIILEYYLKMFWVIYMHIILWTRKPLCMHFVCMLATVHTICQVLTNNIIFQFCKDIFLTQHIFCLSIYCICVSFC